MGQPAWEHVLFLPGRLQACCCHDWDNRSNSVIAELPCHYFSGRLTQSSLFTRLLRGCSPSEGLHLIIQRHQCHWHDGTPLQIA